MSWAAEIVGQMGRKPREQGRWADKSQWEGYYTTKIYGRPVNGGRGQVREEDELGRTRIREGWDMRGQGTTEGKQKMN